MAPPQVEPDTEKAARIPVEIEDRDGCDERLPQQVEVPFPSDQKKRMLLKMDLRIVPLLMMLYLLSYIDRANIGNAKIEGMATDLKLTGNQYNAVLSIFFLTYILFEIPSNYILEKYFYHRPSCWLAIITVLWGVMMTLHGIVQNYGGILAVRLLMGVFEAGLFPGAIVLLNKWYTKYELATRISVFYLGSALAGAFSGLFAYLLAKMDGIGGLEGWRWIFLIEGIATVIAGVIVYFFLTDTPERQPRWLKAEERDYLIERMIAQTGGKKAHDIGSHITKSLLWTVVTDWQMYPMAFVQWSNAVPTYGLKFFLPQIIKGMGYTSSNAQLLTIPPYVAGGISAVVFGRLSDKFRRRAYFLLIPQTCLVVAYAMLTPLARNIKSNVGPCLFAIILANIGCYPINPGTSSWFSNNVNGSAQRALGIAYLISLTNIGGIIASYIFIDSEAPGYPTGFGTSLAFVIAGMIAVGVLHFTYMLINKKRDRMSEDEIREKYSQEDLDKMGNANPFFRFTL